jgi:hypothetical protein
MAFGESLTTFKERYHIQALPDDFIAFYQTCAQAELGKAGDGAPLYRVRPLDRLELVTPRWPADYNDRFRARRDGIPDFRWVRLVDLCDGSYLAFDFDPQWVEPEEPIERERLSASFDEREVFLVIHCREEEPDPRQAYRVVAWSFQELLRRALASQGRLFFQEPGFQDRGDAFTRPRLSGALPTDWRLAIHGPD